MLLLRNRETEAWRGGETHHKGHSQSEKGQDPSPALPILKSEASPSNLGSMGLQPGVPAGTLLLGPVLVTTGKQCLY